MNTMKSLPTTSTNTHDKPWPIEDQHLDVEGGEHVLMQVQKSPALITLALRETWASLYTSMVSESENNPRILDAFALFVRDLYYALGVSQEDGKHDKLGLGNWTRMYDAGLPDLIQDIIMQNRFWTLPRPIIVGYLLDIHMAIAHSSYLHYQPLCPRVLARADVLWTSVWNNREVIANWQTDRPAGRKEHPIIQMLTIYHVLYRFSEKPVPLSSHMPHYSLYAWTAAKVPTEYFKSVFLCDDGADRPSGSPAIFIREAIIDGVGIDACMTRLADVLRGEDPWRCESLEDLKESLGLFGRLMNSAVDGAMALVTAAGSHHIPHLAATLAKKHALTSGLYASPLFYHAIVSLMWKINQHDFDIVRFFPDRLSLIVPGEDVVTILACGIDILSVHGNESEMDYDTDVTLRSVKDFLLANMQVYYEWAKDIKDKKTGNALAVEMELLSGLKRGAQEHWWPSMRALNAAKRRCETRNDDFVRFGTLWKGFGALLGCDAKLERERDVRDAASRCVRLECEYNRKLGVKRFMRCKGCGVHYCSRECQVADWKRGHKMACRRIKDGEAD